MRSSRRSSRRGQNVDLLWLKSGRRFSRWIPSSLPTKRRPYMGGQSARRRSYNGRWPSAESHRCHRVSPMRHRPVPATPALPVPRRRAIRAAHLLLHSSRFRWSLARHQSHLLLRQWSLFIAARRRLAAWNWVCALSCPRPLDSLIDFYYLFLFLEQTFKCLMDNFTIRYDMVRYIYDTGRQDSRKVIRYSHNLFILR